MISKKKVFIFGVLLHVLLIIFLLSAIYPTSLKPDRGIFESVAYRLVAGDKLYSQVWDNKDPLFYYLNAILLSISSFSDVLFEIILIIGISFILFNINNTITKNSKLNFIFSFFLAPLISLQFGYVAGYTHLPGIFLTLLILYFLIKNKLGTVGIVLTFLFFIKILFVPIAITLIFIRYKKNKKNFYIVNKFFILAFLLFNVILFLRREIIGYYYSLYLNYFYATSNYNLLNTLVQAVEFHDLIYISVSLILTFFAYLKYRHDEERQFLINATLAMLIFGIILFLITGRVNHHIQILTPGILLAFSISLFLILRSYSFKKFLLLILVGLLIWQSNLLDFQRNFSYLKWALANDLNPAPEAVLLLENSNSGTYARLGQNDDNAHAKNLKSFELKCPRFHQYPFEDKYILNSSLDCFVNADYLIISPTFKTYDDFADWNIFVTVGNELIEKNFNCKNYSSAKICVNKKKVG